MEGDPFLPLTVFYLLKHGRMCRRQEAHQLRMMRFTAFSTSYGPINDQMNLRGISRPAFSAGLRLPASRSRTMLMCLNVAAINKSPFTIRINDQCLKNLAPLATGRPGIKPFVDRIPASKRFRQVSPRTTDPHRYSIPSIVMRRLRLL